MEGSLFIIRDEDGDVVHTIRTNIRLDNSNDYLKWPGEFKGCQAFKNMHDTSRLGTVLLKVNWSNLRNTPVPDDVVSSV